MLRTLLRIMFDILTDEILVLITIQNPLKIAITQNKAASMPILLFFTKLTGLPWFSSSTSILERHNYAIF